LFQKLTNIDRRLLAMPDLRLLCIREADIHRGVRHVSKVPLADIQLVADGDLGDVGILRVSWPFSRIAAIKTIPAAAWV
jgi:hypothetical protein